MADSDVHVYPVDLSDVDHYAGHKFEHHEGAVTYQFYGEHLAGIEHDGHGYEHVGTYDTGSDVDARILEQLDDRPGSDRLERLRFGPLVVVHRRTR